MKEHWLKRNMNGYPGAEKLNYSSYDPAREEQLHYDRRRMHALEGAGRNGWDMDQNRGYGSAYGNESGPSTYAVREGVKHFKGKGSKSYRRSDERILEDVNERLLQDCYIDATEVDVQVQNGEVVLSGNVDSRSAKRRAEDLAEQVQGVTNVENRLRIR